MKLSPTNLLAMILGSNRVYLLTRVDGCEDETVTHHNIGHEIFSPTTTLVVILGLNCVYLLTHVEDETVTHHYAGHDIRVKLCIPADPR
jgi:hypothetical protein